MVDFINASGTIGMIISSGTNTLTGSVVATMFFILLFLITMALMFGIPLEFLVVLILPFCIGVASYYSNFMLPVVIILLYVSMIIAKNWLFK
jgi:hypothetical protein